MNRGFLQFLIVVACLSFIETPGQAQPKSLQGSLGSISRTSPLIGFNTNSHIPPNFPTSGYAGANWTQSWFIDSTAVLNPEILRFPGGTNANHWDWKTGWFKPGYQPPGTPLVIRTDEFKPGVIKANAKGLFVLNLETSNVQYEMDGLRHADSLGLNPSLFELGNEHNLNGGTTYPLQQMAPDAYAKLGRVYFDSIKARFPQSRICAVGGNTLNGAGKFWNDSVVKYIPNIDALAFHVYLTANNADLAFNVTRALAIPFGAVTDNTTLAYRYNTAGFSSPPANKEVWVTEYNLEETQIASVPVIARTWTHALYITAMNHFYLTKPNIKMIINHSLASSAVHYESISKQDRHLTANGIAMKLLLDVSKGSQNCQNLDFSGNPSISYGSAIIPKLSGWKFKHSGKETGFICNFSKDTFKVSLSGIFSGNIQFSQYRADTAFVVSGISSLNLYSGNTNDSMLVYPFSISQIQAVLPAGVIGKKQAEYNRIWIYPNPSNGQIHLHTAAFLSNAEISIYNMQGQAVKKIPSISGATVELSTSGFAPGQYFIKIRNGSEQTTGSFWVE